MNEDGLREKIDLRGLPCPQPVIKTKKLLDDPKVMSVEALVDDQVNVQNLSRLANSLKIAISVESEGSGFRVVLDRVGGTASLPAGLTKDHRHAPQITGKTATPTESATIVLISKDRFGDGDPEFSTNLLNLFLQTLFEAGHRPQAILMLNSGVKLMAQNSPFEKVLQDFREHDVEVLACGLCVEFYGLKEVVPKEQITNMFAICEYMHAADKIISP